MVFLWGGGIVAYTADKDDSNPTTVAVDAAALFKDWAHDGVVVAAAFKPV